jgi:diaminopimelate decarboxylase|tara:strand:- start:296 stop:526 length:231 start_codon:yes stop_codon:yes gene_type:complete
VSFHVGTGGVSFASYDASIRNARMIFDAAKKLGMQKMDFLDLGGGWSQIHPNVDNCFVSVGTKVAKLIDEVFPEKI